MLKRLVGTCYTGAVLDEERVLEIAKSLNRKNLKAFIRALKLRKRETEVFVELPFPRDEYQALIEQLFPGKKVLFVKNKQLLLGIRITDNDTIYSANLHSRFEDVAEHLKQTYD